MVTIEILAALRSISNDHLLLRHDSYTRVKKEEGFTPLFFCIIISSKSNQHEQRKTKSFTHNLKEVVDELESEVYSDVDAYKNEYAFSAAPLDYDEMYDDGSD